MFQSVLNALLQKYVSPYVKNVKKAPRSNTEPCVFIFGGSLQRRSNFYVNALGAIDASMEGSRSEIFVVFSARVLAMMKCWAWSTELERVWRFV